MPDTPESARAQTQAARRERRNARRLWRKDILNRAATGESRKTLAEEQDVSLSTIQRALTRARAERPLESRVDFFNSHRQRLERAVQLADERVEGGDLSAAYVLIQLLPLLENFDDKHRNLATYGKTCP